MNKIARLKKLEARLSKDEMIVFIPAALVGMIDVTIPEGSTLRRAFNGKSIIDTILTHKEYLEEISNCDNLISIGEA